MRKAGRSDSGFSEDDITVLDCGHVFETEN